MLIYKRAINLLNLNNLLSSLCFNPKTLNKKISVFCAEELKRPCEEQSNYSYLISKQRCSEDSIAVLFSLRSMEDCDN